MIEKSIETNQYIMHRWVDHSECGIRENFLREP